MKAEQFLLKDPVLHLDMTQVLARGTARVLYDGTDGLLLEETRSGVLHLSAETACGIRLLEQLGEAPDCIVVHQQELEQYLKTRGLTGENPCWQAAYLQKEPLPLAGALEIRSPDEADYPTVRQTYHLADDEELYRDFHGDSFFGAYVEGRMVGYVGVHDDGTMGMLEVLPAFRRRGYGEELCRFIINHQLSQGVVPFGQIIYNNEKSIRLQQKLGLSFSKSLLYWMWQED